MDHLYHYARACCGPAYDYAIQCVHDFSRQDYAFAYLVSGTLVLYAFMVVATNMYRIDTLETQFRALQRSTWQKNSVLKTIEDKLDDLNDFVRNRVVLQRDLEPDNLEKETPTKEKEL